MRVTDVLHLAAQAAERVADQALQTCEQDAWGDLVEQVQYHRAQGRAEGLRQAIEIVDQLDEEGAAEFYGGIDINDQGGQT